MRYSPAARTGSHSAHSLSDCQIRMLCYTLKYEYIQNSLKAIVSRTSGYIVLLRKTHSTPFVGLPWVEALFGDRAVSGLLRFRCGTVGVIDDGWVPCKAEDSSDLLPLPTDPPALRPLWSPPTTQGLNGVYAHTCMPVCTCMCLL